jgi:hypothetical protein
LNQKGVGLDADLLVERVGGLAPEVFDRVADPLLEPI